MPDFTEYIYLLSDPRDGSIRYIGRTKDVQDRYYAHISGKSNNSAKDQWIRDLARLSIKPMMEVIEVVSYDIPSDVEGPAERERYWIMHYEDQGAPLFNKPLVRLPITFRTPSTPNLAELQEENARLRAILQRIADVLGVPVEQILKQAPIDTTEEESA